MWQKVRDALTAAAICAAGGAAFYALHAPLPWMLGSLTAAAISAILGRRWFMPGAARGVARPVVGVLAGSAFSAEVVASIVEWWDAILLVLGQSLLVTLLGFLFFRRAAGFDRQTAFFAGAPGGLSEMALLGSSLGGDVRSIVVGHSLRIITVVFTMPFVLQLVLGHPIGRVLPTSPADAPPALFDWAVLALCALLGYGSARLVRFPAGLVVFPMILSAAVHATQVTQAVPPSWLVAMVQVVIGGVVGARFAGIRWREMRRTVVLSFVWAVTMLALAALSAYAGVWLIDWPFHAVMLALAPGGMVEMTILTFSVGIEVAFVVTAQICRILFVLLLIPALYNLVAARRRAIPPAPPTGKGRS